MGTERWYEPLSDPSGHCACPELRGTGAHQRCECARYGVFGIHRSLVNTGATLTLHRADGGLEDQVAGGEDWGGIGGDNITKETAQLTSAGWGTAPATPGAANQAESAAPAAADAESAITHTPTTRLIGRPSMPTTLHAEPSVPTVTVIGPRTVMQNQLVTYTGSVADIGDTIARSMVYRWNFGDTVTAQGREVQHRFTTPGTYALVVQAAYQDYVAESYVPITVLPYSLSLSLTTDRKVRLHNDAAYPVDVSHFTLVSGTRVYTLPIRTYLEPRATLTLPVTAGVLATEQPTLYDAVGTVQARVATPTPAAPSMVAAAPQPAAAAASNFSFVSAPATEPVPVPDLAVSAAPPPAVPASGTAVRWSVYAAWAVLVVIGMAAVSIGRSREAVALAGVADSDEASLVRVPFK